MNKSKYRYGPVGDCLGFGSAGLTHTLCGMRNVEQAKQKAAAWRVELAQEEVDKITAERKSERLFQILETGFQPLFLFFLSTP